MYSRFYDKKYACLKLFGDVKFKELSIEQQEEVVQGLDPTHPQLRRAFVPLRLHAKILSESQAPDLAKSASKIG